MNNIFKLPELGENIKQGTVSSIHVAVGDTLVKEQPVLELETDKAVIEVPSTLEGTITEIMVKEGDVVTIGQEILRVESSADPAVSPSKKQAESVPVKMNTSGDTQTEVSTQVIKAAPGDTQTGDTQAEATGKTDNRQETRVVSEDQSALSIEFVPDSPGQKVMQGPDDIVPASPSVRRFAREIGVDIRAVHGSGLRGRISQEDVMAYARAASLKQTDADSVGTTRLAGPLHEPLPDFSRWGDVERKPLTSLRKSMAQHLTVAWSTIPHVTHFDKADITTIEQFRKDNAEQVASAGGKLTMTAILVKTCAAALKKFPLFNASIDLAAGEMISKHFINIGVAVDTERGLLVPVIHHADKKSLTELAIELTSLAEKARDKKLKPDEMQGSNFSISNLGGIGGHAFTPIVHSPDVAILGVSRAAMEPIYIDGAFVPRLILPLALSYDHRLIDGADAARFLRWLCQSLEQPLRLLLA